MSNVCIKGTAGVILRDHSFYYYRDLFLQTYID